MGYSRQHFIKVRKQSRHAQTSLCVVHCVDCRRPLQVTHLAHRFGERCRKCFDGFLNGAREMASR